jgi:hypothetical protein
MNMNKKCIVYKDVEINIITHIQSAIPRNNKFVQMKYLLQQLRSHQYKTCL